MYLPFYCIRASNAYVFASQFENQVSSGFPGGSDGKESACSVGDQVRSLGWEDPLAKRMATHSSVLAWRIPMDRGPWWATVHGGRKEWDTTERLTHTWCHRWSVPDISDPRCARQRDGFFTSPVLPITENSTITQVRLSPGVSLASSLSLIPLVQPVSKAS